MGYFIYNLFFKQTIKVLPTPIGTTTGPGGLPIAGEGGQQIGTTTGPGGVPTSPGITQPQVTAPVVSPTAQGGLTKITSLNSGPSLSPILSSNGKDVQYYNKTDGKFYKIDENGEAVPMTDKIFHNVDKITWSPTASKAVLEYPDGSNIVYDFNTNRQTTLPKHWESFDFSSDGNQIVSKSIGVDPDNRWLLVSDSNGSKAQALEFIGENADKVISSWSPNNQSVAMYTKGVDFNRQELFFVGLNGENFKSTVIEGRGVQTQWSSQGDRLLYSVYNNNSDLKPKLWVVNAQGDNIGAGRTDLEINTWAEKCTFTSNQELYCAVPDSLERGAGLFPEMANRTQDSLYRINLATGVKQLIAVPDGKYNISNLVVSKDQQNLFFTDKNTQEIYKVNLR
ncbi:MAG: hypothetical protein WC564_03005 [Patescibacteria group bacterium]